MLKFYIFNSEIFVQEGEPEEHRALSELLSFEVPGWEWMVKKNPKLKNWNGQKSSYDRRTGTFPAGLLSYALRKLKRIDIEVELNDQRKILLPKHLNLLDIDLWHGHLQDAGMSPDRRKSAYQVQGVKDALESDMRGLPWPRGVFAHATGAGKTALAALLLRVIGRKSLFLVERLDLWRQTSEVFEQILGQKIGQISKGEFLPQLHTVSTIQTIIKRLKDRAVQKYLQSIEVVILDECQNLTGSKEMEDRYIQLLLELQNAYYRFGISGTPFMRWDLGDVYLHGLFGGVISQLDAKTLVDQDLLAKPDIHMIRITEPELDDNTPGEIVYDLGIVHNLERNLLVARLAKEASQKYPTMILVNRLAHARMIQEFLKAEGLTVPAITYKTPTEKRGKALAQFRRGELSLLVVSSLPADELLLVRGECSGIMLVSIEEFFTTLFAEDSWEIFTRLKGKIDGWSKVTGVIRHEKSNLVVETFLRGGANVQTTENHSLIDQLGNSVPPMQGVSIQQVLQVPLEESIIEIDVIKRLRTTGADLEGVEIVVEGLSQTRVRELKKELAWLEGEEVAWVSTKKSILERLSLYDTSYYSIAQAIRFVLSHVRYRKGFFRIDSWPEDSESLKMLSVLHLHSYLSIRYSPGRWRIPTFISVTEELGNLAGIFAAEGSTGTPKSKHFMSGVAAREIVKKDVREGFREKQTIREVYVRAFEQVFGRPPRMNGKQILSDGKIPYLFFRYVLGIGGKAPDKQVPWFVWNSSSSIREAFLYGYFLGDGHRNLQSNMVEFVTTSRRLAVGTYLLLLSLGKARVGVYKMEPKGSMNFSRYGVRCYSRLFGFSMKEDTSRGANTRPAHALVSTVREARKQDDPYVYDVCVEEVERFYAGFGVLCHNSIFEVGVDIQDLRFLIVASGGKSAIKAIQRLGRGMRKKESANRITLVDFLDETHSLLEEASLSRLSAYRREGYEVRILKRKKP